MRQRGTVKEKTARPRAANEKGERQNQVREVNIYYYGPH
jgi:hypothetical protein